MSTTTISAGGSISTIVSSGDTLDVLSGGTASGVVILSGGVADFAGIDAGTTIDLGGSIILAATATETNITIASGGTETLNGGTVTGGAIYGLQQVLSTTGALITGETIYNGGTLAFQNKTNTFASGVIESGGVFSINGNATGLDLTLAGGTIALQSPKANLQGVLSFSGAGTLLESAVVSAGAGDLATIYGFGAGDAIDLELIGTGATLTSAVTGGNMVETVTSGGVSESFTFSGTSAFLSLQADGGAGVEIVETPVTLIASGVTSAGLTVTSGAVLEVQAGGTITGATIAAGGTALVYGTDAGSLVQAGGNETVYGTAAGDTINGIQSVSGTLAGGTIATGGTVNLAGSASDLVLSGGRLVLNAASASLGGGLTFAGAATLTESAVISAGYGDNAVISGFAAGDVIDFAAIGTGATLTSATTGGNTVLTISGGSTEGTIAETLTFAGTATSFALALDASSTGEIVTLASSGTATPSIPVLTSFTAGDIVISVVGDVNDSGVYGDNQAAPVMLEEIDPATGQIVGEMLLPQTSNGADSAISGEYGSSSEGILELSADGKSLTIMGYGVNAATFNEGGAAVYGSAALAQSTSIEGGPYTAVARVVADISYSGNIDTSTAIYDIANTNNPRSVVTVDGTSFWISGQGVKGDTTQGVFEATDGTASATAIDTANDTREVEIYNGQLYLSEDSSAGPDNIASFGGLPTSATTPAILSGINQSIILSAAQANSVNGDAVGTQVDLSPEQFFFANATTLYVADGGQPKAGTVGDGGLQKWILDPTTGKWSLAYTLSAGLNLVENANVSSDTAGTTGLIGLSAMLHADGTVTFYATNSTIGDLDQTYLYTITDVVSATTAPTGESFSVVTTAASDTNIRGIAAAPSAPTNTEVTSGQTAADLTISGGGSALVDAGGTLSGAVILSGGTATILGADIGSLIVAGGDETVSGTATGDNIYGTQLVSAATAVVMDETVYDGGALDLFLKGAVADGIVVSYGGALNLSGNVIAETLTINGGAVVLQSPKANLEGNITFTGAGIIAEQAVISAGYGAVAVISGFTGQDVIDLQQVGFAGATLVSADAGGNTVETVVSGAVSESFTFAGTYAQGQFAIVQDAGSGTEIVIAASTESGALNIASGGTAENVTFTAGASVTVAAGGGLISATLLSGASAVVAGSDAFTTIESGGYETVSGSATGDAVHGTQLVSAGTAVVTNETVYNGGAIDLFLKGGVADGIAVSSGGALNLSGNVIAETLTIDGGAIVLQSPKANLEGAITFAGAGTIEEQAVISAGYGASAIISGFAYGDVIELASLTTGGTLLSSVAGGNTVETITNGTISESFTFAGTYAPGFFTLTSSDALVVSVSESAANTLTISSGQAAPAGYVVSSGHTLDILSDASAQGAVILSGGTANITGTDNATTITAGGAVQLLSGGVETSVTLEAGGIETLNGGTIAGGDVYGLQQVLTGTTGVLVSNETIFNGGTLAFGNKSNTFASGVIESGGVFSINGNATGENLVINGGTIDLQSPKANLQGALSFTGTGGKLLESDLISAGIGGDLATIYGFGAGDVIDLSVIGTGASLTSLSAGGLTTIAVTGGTAEEGATEYFTFSGTGLDFALATDASGTGMELLADTSVVSSGTVAGGTIGAGSALLVQSGGTVTGAVVSGGSAVISGTESGGTIIAGGTEFVASGGVASGTTVEQNSTQTLGNGAVAYDVTVGDPSVQSVSAGAIANGTTIVAGGEQIVLSGGTANGSVIEAGGIEIVQSGGTANGTQLETGGTLDLAALTFSTGGTAIWDSGAGLLTVTEGGVSETLSLSGTYGSESFTLAADENGGTAVQVICYLRGTRLLTLDGEVPVEALRQGDELVTRFGGAQKIKWIGRQSFLRRFVEKNPETMPVRFAPGSLDGFLPRRALYVSGGHSMFIGGQLVLARDLVNGVTITRGGAPEAIEYYQIEFETHDCVRAEGAWSESYADAEGMRNMFHNAGSFYAQFPDYVAPSAPVLCAPRYLEGKKLEAALRPVVALAAAAVVPGALHGYMETATTDGVTGWAWDEANPELPVLLEIRLDGEVAGTALACVDRQDVAAAGYGAGRCGFSWSGALPADAASRLEIRRVADGAVLYGRVARTAQRRAG